MKINPKITISFVCFRNKILLYIRNDTRIRKTIEGFNDKTKTLYDINQKKYLEKGVSQEFEKQISKTEYENLFKNKDSKIATLNKTRYVFNFN